MKAFAVASSAAVVFFKPCVSDDLARAFVDRFQNTPQEVRTVKVGIRTALSSPTSLANAVKGVQYKGVKFGGVVRMRWGKRAAFFFARARRPRTAWCLAFRSTYFKAVLLSHDFTFYFMHNRCKNQITILKICS